MGDFGSQFIRMFYYRAVDRMVCRCENLSAEVRMFLTVGFCGGFTTFSTFASESLLLLKAGEWLNFSLYTVISVTCGIALTALGSFIALSVRNG